MAEAAHSPSAASNPAASVAGPAKGGYGLPFMIRVPQELLTRLQAAADADRRSLSNFVIKILEDWLARRPDPMAGSGFTMEWTRSPERMIQFGVRLPAEIREQIGVVAQREGGSLSNLCHHILNQELTAKRPGRQRKARG